MKIRRTQLEELDILMDIYDQARLFMQQTGNTGQWVNGYPSREVIIRDIERNFSYVCVNEEDEIIGTFCFTQGVEDPTYLKIYEGEWLNDKSYGVIHRLASSKKSKGFADFCFDWCFRQSGNIRIDTHKDNKVLQHILTKNGYIYCGIIYTESGGERLAFQKTL